MISELAQSSNTKNKIYLREATVKQARDFSDVVESHSEKVTTEFLNVVQAPESFTDSRTWTEGDRLTALIWYHIHTTKDTHTSVDYLCPFCKKNHSNYFDTRSLVESHQAIKGQSFRETDVLGKKLTFRPLVGSQLEEIQAVKRELKSKGESKDSIEDELMLERIVHSFSFTNLPSKSYDERKEWVLGLGLNDYWELIEVYKQAQDSMRHGVNYRYNDGDICFVLPPHHCINKHELPEEQKEGAVTQLLWPFLCGNFIPSLQPR